jgi:hypothetical protein
MSKIYYKVVSCDRKGNFYSLFVIGKRRVEYKVGKWVEAHKFCRDLGYHLCIFNTIYDALNFGCRSFLKIYECHVKGIIKDLPKNKYAWPAGTVMAKKVKLIREH